MSAMHESADNRTGMGRGFTTAGRRALQMCWSGRRLCVMRQLRMEVSTEYLTMYRWAASIMGNPPMVGMILTRKQEATTGHHQHLVALSSGAGRSNPSGNRGCLELLGTRPKSHNKTIKTGTPLSLCRHDPLPFAVLIGQHPEPLTAQNWPGWEAAGQGCDCLPSFLLMSLNLSCLFSLFSAYFCTKSLSAHRRPYHTLGAPLALFCRHFSICPRRGGARAFARVAGIILFSSFRSRRDLF